jgi:hypothetical protein
MKGSFIFFFNHLIDGVVCKLIGAEGQGLRSTNSKQLNEGDIMQWCQVSFDICFIGRIYYHQRYEELVKTNGKIIDLNITYKKLYANLNTEIVKHGDTL